MTEPLADEFGDDPNRIKTGWFNCIVDHVDIGAAADGGDAVFLQVGDDVVPSIYLGSAPAPGATVWVQFQDGSPIIHGRPMGYPAL